MWNAILLSKRKRDKKKVRSKRQEEGKTLADRYRYHPHVLQALAGHGLRPLPGTPPQQLRDAVLALYKYEIKGLRARLLAGEIEKRHYAGRVIELRRRYPVLSIPVELWTMGE